MGFNISNRKAGTDFERQLCASLMDAGYWCHRMAQTAAGQPFDVIAARSGTCIPIDCKVCEKDVFPLHRVEDNQFSAMSLWRETGNGESYFALKLSDGAVYMLSFSAILSLGNIYSSLNRRLIEQCAVPLEEWVGKP